jgi:hypothetical protein
MNMLKYLLLALVLTGCASRPLIDPKSSTHPENYYADEMECARIAEDVSYAKNMAVKGTIQGGGSALLAHALADSANKGSGAAALAGLLTGLVMGMADGAYTTYERREKILRTCLGGRGYKVLE